VKQDMNTLRQTDSKPSSTRVPITPGGPACYGSYVFKTRFGKIDETLELIGMRVLDLGCGSSCYTAALALRAAYICGVDIQMPHLEAFGQPIPGVQGTGESLPFASEKFDVVTMIEALEHTDCDRRALKECC